MRRNPTIFELGSWCEISNTNTYMSSREYDQSPSKQRPQLRIVGGFCVYMLECCNHGLESAVPLYILILERNPMGTFVKFTLKHEIPCGGTNAKTGYQMPREFI